jgi:hypothetical protein
MAYLTTTIIIIIYIAENRNCRKNEKVELLKWFLRKYSVKNWTDMAEIHV